ncbi:MAG: hypothetical protein KAS35_07940 [Candidatus Marinimicrobia bacterium]|nr:hypothetical protein [Candidatus Neomarinimicrobiota bacterium]
MKIIIAILISLIIVVSCVGPEEPLDGLSKNTPVVVNTNEAFTFSLIAENYSTEETYNLTFSEQNPIELATVLIVTDFAGRASDTSYFDIFNSNDSLLDHYMLNSNINVTPIENLETNAIPKKIFFKADDFSGLIQLVLAIGD